MDLEEILPKQVTKLFARDKVQTDNFIFHLHRNFTFIIIIIGILFISAQNYLNENAITCASGDDYVNAFCFLHGAAHIPRGLQGKLSKDSRCTSDEGDTGNRHTAYYIWLPFILTLCAVITKIPWMIWKNTIERGTMAKFVMDSEADKEEAVQKNGERFYKVAIKESWTAPVYNIGFTFCEILNIAAICLNRHILDLLLNGKFYGYGTEVHEYFAKRESAPDLINPTCNVFPTEVSCSVYIGGINGNPDLTNTICLLSNNVFN